MLKKIALWCIALLLLWIASLGWFLSQIPASPLPDNTSADAIVVLTGSKGRLEYGLQLLAEGKGKSLFISGAKAGRAEVLQQVSPELRHAIAALPEAALTLGRQAENTIGNAEETSLWIKEKNIKSILLVTASYHMPRAQSEFSEAVSNIVITPAPIFPDDFSLAGWWQRDNDRRLLLSEYHKFLAGKFRHQLIFFLHNT